MTHSTKTVLIVGIGVLGGQLLDQLALKFPDHRYVVVARNAEYLLHRTNLTVTVLAQWRLYPEICIETCDITNVRAFAEIIRFYKPDIVFNATTPFPWWKIAQLPANLSELANRTGPGMWCALDAILPMKIGEAITASGLRTIFVNGCYPDLTNAFLAGDATPPLIGIGNISNVIPGLRIVLSRETGVSPEDIELRLICHHFTSLNAPLLDRSNAAPFLLWVRFGDFERIYADDDFPFRLLRSSLPRLRGVPGQAVTASSAALILSVFLRGASEIFHAPGPRGLPGGYPVRLASDGSVEVALPRGITLDQAIQVNERGQELDGTAHVAPGLIRPTEHAKDSFAKIVGFDLPDISLSNVFEVANAAIDALNEKYGLELNL